MRIIKKVRENTKVRETAGETMSNIELGPVIFGSMLDLIQWLQRKGLLASSQDCGRCSVHMSLVPRTQQGGVWMAIPGGAHSARQCQ